MRALWMVGVIALATGCVTSSAQRPLESLTAKAEFADRCGNGKPLRIHVFDVHQALAALVELPGGERILVDTGDSRTKAELYDRMEERVATLLNGKPLSMLWITHQHSDHLGHAADVLGRFHVRVLVDNGTSDGAPQVKKMHEAARAVGTAEVVVSPTSATVPLSPGAPVTLTAVVPRDWTEAKCKAEPNDCSIGLRVDYCDSSVLFLGDAEGAEEGEFANLAPVTLLQAGHHGSSTSSSAGLLEQLKPRYVVLSSGAPFEGLNKGFCHPSRSSVRRLAVAVGGPPTGHITAFKDDELKCRNSKGEGDWDDVPVGANVYSTARDGDVTFTTFGDGTFEVMTESTR